MPISSDSKLESSCSGVILYYCIFPLMFQGSLLPEVKNKHYYPHVALLMSRRLVAIGQAVG